MTQHSCNSDSVQHAFQLTSSISRRHSAHESTSMRFGLNLDSEGYWSRVYDLLGSHTNFPGRLYIWIWYRIESKLHRGRLVCGVPSTYAGSWKEGMSHWVRIAWLDLCDSDIIWNPNCVEDDSCAKCLLLMLKVERRECRTNLLSPN